MSAYCIKDSVSGCFLSEHSFYAEKRGDPWEIKAYTGKLGTTFYTRCEIAQEALKNLEKLNKESGNRLQLHIVEVDIESLPLGQAIKL